MNRSTVLLLVVLPVLLLSFVSRSSSRENGPRIAIVDLPRVIRDHEASKRDYETIERWKKEKEQMLEEKGKALKKRQDAMDSMDPAKDEYRRELDDIKIDGFRLKTEGESLTKDLELKTAEALTSAHKRAVAACRKYLDDHDLDLVLQVNPAPVGGRSQNEVVNEIVLREVVVHRASLDVTDAVLAILNGS